MAVCYLDKRYNEKYDCQYEIKNNGIEIIVNYDITDEIPENNGLRILTNSTKFKNMDILIIDYYKGVNYLLKNAYYSGGSTVSGTPDGGYKTKFFSNIYFYDKKYERLYEIEDNNIKKIKIYSNIINDFIGYPSLSQEKSDKEYVIRLKKDTEKKSIEINENNIKSLKISDDWIKKEDLRNNEINIKLDGFIEIELNDNINYDDTNNYVYELMNYFQLIKPCKFKINKILVEIEKKYYALYLPITEIEYVTSYVENSVDDNLSKFLLNCYNKIPYRNSKNEIRNIPFIIIRTSRNIEDNFLMFYRFIECYYKKQKITDIQQNFIKYSIDNNYDKNKKMTSEEKEKLVQEIISLRNHYVHTGYYIKNQKLWIIYPKVNKKANPKNSIATNIDFNWIYEKTLILYKIVIDIIFTNMLGYEKYKYNKHF